MIAVLLEIVMLALLLLVNGLFSASEMAIVSSKKSRLMRKADEGRRGAVYAMELASSPGNLLSTVQIGMTSAGILSGFFSGGSSAEALERTVAKHIPQIAEYASVVSVCLMLGLTTYVSIVVGELLPKRLALRNPESFASWVAPLMRRVAHIASPLVVILNRSTELLLKLAGRHAVANDILVTGEEIKVLVEQGTREGLLEHAEMDIVNRVLAFGGKSIHDMMTPRHQIVWLDIESDFESNREKVARAPHSHFPIARGSFDDVLGTVHVKDLFSNGISRSSDLAGLLTPPLFIPDSSVTIQVIETFRQSGAHVAFVLDEYGKTQGMVTLTDLLEAVVGAFRPNETGGGQIQVRGDGSTLMDATLPIDEFKEHFSFDALPGESHARYRTLAGYALSMFGRVPAAGEFFFWNHHRFEVIDMDGFRIGTILVRRVDQDA